MVGSLQADQSISFQAMSVKLRQMMDIVRADPAVENVIGYTGVGSGRRLCADQHRECLRFAQTAVGAGVRWKRCRAVRPNRTGAGGRLYLAAIQDLRAGGRQSNAQYQYTLQSENVQDLYTWTPKFVDALEHNPVLTDVSSDQQQRGLETISPSIANDGAARRLAAADRQHALRRLRSAAGLDHLQRDQSVPRRDGDRSALHAIPQFIARCVCRDLGRNARERQRPMRQEGTSRRRRRRGRPSSRRRGSPPLPAIGTAAGLRLRHRAPPPREHQEQFGRNSFTNALANTGHGPPRPARP